MDSPKIDQLLIRIADFKDREEIYRIRHKVYGVELQQHPTNEQQSLSDTLDVHNVYLVAKRCESIVGFISITPEDSPRFSIDKYLDRCQHPTLLSKPFVELRLLTVIDSSRGGFITSVLLYAATRWLQVHNAQRILAIGRDHVMKLYRKIGFEPLGVPIRSGCVNYELMSIDRDRMEEVFRGHPRLANRIRGIVKWDLEFSITKEIECYHGGASIEPLGCNIAGIPRQMEIVNADVLDAWFPPSTEALSVFREFAPWLARTSPPAQPFALERVISEIRGVDSSSVVSGAGSSDLIFRAFQTWVKPSSKVLLVSPCYGEYEFVCKHVIGCQVDHLTLSLENQFRLSSEEFVAHVNRGYDLVVVVNPNNPTGVHLNRSFWKDCLARVPLKTRIWVDECYIDYVDTRDSLERIASRSPNLIVCKSLSKSLSLSGMRIGYLILHPNFASDLRLRTPPWNIGTISQLAAAEALKSQEYYRTMYKITHELRQKLETRVRDLGFIVFPGTANFFLAFLPASVPSKQSLLEYARSESVYLRDTFPTSPCLGNRAIRIAVKDAKSNQRIVKALEIGVASLREEMQ